MKAQSAAYQEKKKDDPVYQQAQRERARKWRSEHLEQARANVRKSNAAIKAKRDAFRILHPRKPIRTADAIREYKRQWALAHRETLVMRRREARAAARLARKNLSA